MGPKHTEHPVQVGAFSGCCFGTGQSVGKGNYSRS